MALFLRSTLGIATLAMLFSTSALAQARVQEKPRAPENLLPPQPAPTQTPAPTKVDKAFGDLTQPVAGEVVQQVASLEGVWTAAQANQLLAFIPKVKAEGLDPADYQATELTAAIAAGEGQALNTLASRIFVWLVEDLRDGRTPMEARRQWFVVDPDADRMPTGRLLEQALTSGDIAGTLCGLNPVHPDYALLKAELGRTAETDTARRKLIRANMDRWRWLGQDLGRKYLLTNVPEFQLRLTVNNKIIKSYRTVVGKPGRTATPQLAEMVEAVIFNPTWTVPQSIVKGEGLGARVIGNPRWAKANGYKGTKGENGFINVVQQPGPGNSLGLMKLDMPNEHAIFLHDTPAKHLFAQDSRALSHGCIRVEGARELAMTMSMLGNMKTKEDIPLIQAEVAEITAGGVYTRYPMINQWPVYITYFTMAQDIDGKLRSFNDLYERDAPVLAALDAPRSNDRARKTKEEVIEIVDDLQTT